MAELADYAKKLAKVEGGEVTRSGFALRYSGAPTGNRRQVPALPYMPSAVAPTLRCQDRDRLRQLSGGDRGAAVRHGHDSERQGRQPHPGPARGAVLSRPGIDDLP